METVKGEESCQHSSVDSPLAAEMAVRLSNVGVAIVLANNWRMERIKMKDMVLGGKTLAGPLDHYVWE